jgi:hypothetical protein
LITAAVVATGLEHPLSDTVTAYVPVATEVAPEIIGFCKEEVNPFGPVQLYVAPDTVGVFKESDAPAHKGLLFDAVGAEGNPLTLTTVVAGALWQPATVTTTLYVPA